MILISHRGNITGPIPDSENRDSYIDYAIKNGYDVEIDLWYKNDTLWLGHDKPDYETDLVWISDRIDKLWIHCKNIEAIDFFNNCKMDFNYFWHETDTLTLTSKKYIWAYPGKQPIRGSIAVMPEIYLEGIESCLGICSDYIQKYRIEE
jgi:hypothetical protein